MTRQRTECQGVSAASKRLPALLMLLLFVGLMSCVDTDPPPWFNGSIEGNVLGDSDGLTAVKEEQVCTQSELQPPIDALRVHFIDVGQGDAIWVQTPDGRNILIDAGDGGFFGRTDGSQFVQAYLVRNGFPQGSTFDAVVVTHAHSDHYGGLLNLMKSYDTNAYVDPGHQAETISYGDVIDIARAETEGTNNFFRPAISAESGGLVTMKGGPTDLFGPEVSAWVMHAESFLRLGDDSNAKVNNTSVVIRLNYAGKTMLLMGDAHSEVEFEMVARFALNEQEPKLDTNLLKVGHHGSETSSSSRFLSAVYRNVPEAERFAVIMSGRTAFGGTQLPSSNTIFRIAQYIDERRTRLFSTEAGDDLKGEDGAPGDDNILAVVRPNGQMYVCYPDAMVPTESE